MSGGVGPCKDIRLPKEHQQEQENNQGPISKSPQNTTTTTAASQGGFFAFRQLNTLAIIVVFSASGMVSIEDFAFFVFSLIYMYFMSRVAFPTLSAATMDSQELFDQKKKLILSLYTSLGALLGLVLPILYIFQGILEGDTEGIKAATPHVFLLASQLFLEGLASAKRFSIPIGVFVPIFYNSRRIFTVVEWLRVELVKGSQIEYSGSRRRLCVGRGLAIANLVFWCFNLFGFLLPIYIPRAFKKYYSNKKDRD